MRRTLVWILLSASFLSFGTEILFGGEKVRWITNNECTVVGDPRARKGGTLKLHLSEFPRALRAEGPYQRNPVLMTIHGLLYEPLLLLDPETLDYIPALASHWRFSKDRKTFWLKIDPRARWSDGKQVLASDVVSTWYYLQHTHLGEGATDTKFAGGFREVAAEEPDMVRVRLWGKNWRRFHFFVCLPVFPASFIGRKRDMYAEEYYAQIPIGTGPYALNEGGIRWGRSLALERRKDYWAAGDRRNVGKYNFDRIVWSVLGSPEVALGRFLKGSIDVFDGEEPSAWKAAGKADPVKMGWIQKRQVYTEKPAVYTAFVFNMRKPPFNDQRVRLAFAHLFNRERICREHFHGLKKMANSYYPGRPWSRAARKVRYNPNKAKELLSQAGYRFRAQDGWFYRSDGNVFSIVLLYADRSLRRVLQSVTLEMQSAGIKCTHRQVSRSMLMGGLAKNEFALHFLRWETSVLPDPAATWSSSRAKGRVGNLAGLRDKRIDDLCIAYYKTEERERQLEILGQVDARVARQHPFALGWYSDHTRILFWDKFRFPATVFSRLGDASDVLSTWWIDKDKAEALKKAKSKREPLAVGETVVDPWKRRGD
ncbi:MAG: ABC transporter substrate-binding protein [Planctomycetota bacterium]|jgi:microcin C transport system substrate-binding protein